jgi:trigger factor
MDESFLSNYGVETEDDLKEQIRTSLQVRAERQARVGMVEQVYKYMLENTKFELPTDIAAAYSTNLLRRQYANLISRGLPREQVNEHMDRLKASSDQQAQEQLKTFFIMDRVAEKLEVEVNDEELNGQIAMLAVQQGQRPEKLRQEMERNGSLEQYRQQIRDEKCVDKLLESAEVTEVKPEKTPKKAKKEDGKEKKTKKTVKKTKKSTAKKKTGASSPDKSPAKKQKKTTKKKTDK